jgi:hypothetical protein
MLATIAAFPHAPPRNPIVVREHVHPLAVLGMEKNSAVILTFVDRAVKDSCAFYGWIDHHWQFSRSCSHFAGFWAIRTLFGLVLHFS